MSKIEQSMEKALKLRDRPMPVRKREHSVPEIYTLPPSEKVKDKEPHLRDYLDVLIRRKMIVIVFLAAVVVTVTIASFLMTPLYRTRAVIQLSSGKTELVEFRDVYKSKQNLETQYNILKSRNLAKRVADKLSLESVQASHDAGLVSSFIQSVRSLVSTSEVKKQVMAKERQGIRISTGTIMKGLEIVPIKNTELIAISFTSPYPKVASLVTNTLAEEYISLSHETKLLPTQKGGMRLRKEVEEMKEKLEASEMELNNYIAQSQIIVSTNDKDYENLLAKKFSLLTQELDHAIAERISTEAIYQEIKKSGTDYNIVLEKSAMKDLMKEYMELELEYFRLLKIHKPAYPKMVQLKDELKHLRNRIETEEQNIINTLHSDYTLALKKEKLLSSALEEIRQELTAFQQNMVAFYSLQREVNTNRDIYNSLFQRLKEVDITTALADSNVQVLDRARVPKRPYKPQKAFNIALSLIFGLFGGVFIAFFVEYFDTSIKTDDDVEKITGLPVLGTVPISNVDPVEITNDSLTDNLVFPEAFRSIGTRVQFSLVSNSSKLILITSPMEKEGKSITSLNIAMSLISSQEKGIIVDADLRRPDVHAYLNLNNSVGLSSFLAGLSEFDGLIKQTPYTGLDVITAGPIPLNPSELLNSSRMRELIDALSATYDYVIFDSAPVLGMSDSLILSTILESVILIVRANQTPRDALAQTHKALMSVNANTVGVVLNGVEMKKKYAYSSYYSSSYLKGNGNKKELV